MVQATTRFHGKYLSLTTFKRDGTAVATPVWFVEQDGKLLVQTDLESGKVKRIKANPQVRLALCNGMGHLRGPTVNGRAEILEAGDTVRVERFIKDKYRWDMLIIGPFRWAQRALHLGKVRGPTVGLAITTGSAD
jgi:PPOX class probable F420-dependent enzyme